MEPARTAADLHGRSPKGEFQWLARFDLWVSWAWTYRPLGLSVLDLWYTYDGALRVLFLELMDFLEYSGS